MTGFTARDCRRWSRSKVGDPKYSNQAKDKLGGLPAILLQMPIWIALYRVLSKAGELYQQPFIPGWIEVLITVG